MRLWDFAQEDEMTESSTDWRFTVDMSGFIDAANFLAEALDELNEIVSYSTEMEHWERHHRVPRRRRTRPRDNRNACEKGRRSKEYHRGDHAGFSSGSWIYNGDDVVIRGNKRWVPPLPDDFGEALWEAIMEEYGWPIEEDDSHPEMADYRKREQQRQELDALYYDDFMTQLEIELAPDYEDDLIDEPYGDEEYEAAARDPFDDEWLDHYDWRTTYRNGGWADDDYDY